MDGWYYSQNGQSVGPITLAQLKQMVAARQLSGQDHVWHESLPDWTEARKVPGLAPQRTAAAQPATAGRAQAAQPQAHAAQARTVQPSQVAQAEPAMAYAPSPQAVAEPQQADPSAYYAQQPQGVLGYQGTGMTDPVISPLALGYLRQSRGWVMLFAVLFFLGAAFSVVVGIVVLGTGTLAGAANVDSDMPAGFMMGMAVAYLLIALVYGGLGFYLVKFFSASGHLIRRRQANDVEATFQSILHFWRLAGICVVAGIVLYVLLIVLVVVGSIA